MPVEPNDIKVLIPRVRRALEGPASTASPGSPTLDDEDVEMIVADAIANVIFYSEGAFGHTLDVTDRDDAYGSPKAWQVNPPLTEAEASVVVAQAALDHFFSALRDLKTQETIKDEGTEWSYSLSATLMRDQINVLRAARDSALEILAAKGSFETTAYYSLLAVRDQETSNLIEEWL